MEIAAFSYQQGKKIWDTVQSVNSVRRSPESSAGGVSFLYNQPFMMDEAETKLVPGYAVMEVSGYVTVGDTVIPTVMQASTTQSRQIMLNGPSSVERGELGAGTFPQHGVPYLVLCSTTDDMEPGMPLGLREDKWYLERGGGFAEIVAPASADIAEDLCMVILNQGSSSHILRTTIGGIAGRVGLSASQGDATPYWLNSNGSLEELLDGDGLAQTVKVYHIGSGDIAGEAYIQAKTYNNRLVADFEDCA